MSQVFSDQMISLVRTLEKEAHTHQRLSHKQWARLVKQFPQDDGRLFSKDQVIQAYRFLAGEHGLAPYDEAVVAAIRMKPQRTLSGVTPVTVLTKPFPCPGKCIFCPNDVRMPKSYLSDEPGAQRAERNYFDPYLQTYNRLQAYHNIGHPVDKVEIIVLGGTWSYYPEPYQIWFIKECFRALNDFGNQDRDGRSEVLARYAQAEQTLAHAQAHVLTNEPEKNRQGLAEVEISGENLDKTYNQVISETYVAPEKKAGLDTYQTAEWAELETQQQANESAGQRCVGLVIETRPDNISEAEVIRIRRLGCTKAQIGFQSLNDAVLEKNKRGHAVAATRRAVRLLRQAGFKIHAHWMANLHGSSVKADKADFQKLFDDSGFRPDELKIYPCSLISSAELMQYYQRGEWQPYSHHELLEVLTFALKQTPRYCRLTRVIRDIPSPDIVVGNTKTNFRQIAEQELSKAGQSSVDIRAREIRNTQFDPTQVKFKKSEYQASNGQELFLEYVVPVAGQEKLLGFLRLQLPKESSFIDELADAAMIREVHVYGQTLGVGKSSTGQPQHLGLGTKLLKKAASIARSAGFQKLAVISAIGTRGYYRSRGFTDGRLYQFLDLR